MRRQRIMQGVLSRIVVSFDEFIFSYAEGIYVKFRHTAVFLFRHPVCILELENKRAKG
jgi:hypothetical protein